MFCHQVSACLGIVGIIYNITSDAAKSAGMLAFEIIFVVVLFALAVGSVFGLKRLMREMNAALAVARTFLIIYRG
ncbi:hypothetical protein BV898_17467 [Hypsibius exemplaris]|uniref:Uncharacterized protein n=1 Tax=Hypsibius exemplaris TaxID=2072580 RepID=A0A9X6RMU2_HYPEX|nr:hypothetical protein BV898_17467 [Hypsibius exemplaris]